MVFEYIEVFQNRRSLHSTVGYESLARYEKGRIRAGFAT